MDDIANTLKPDDDWLQAHVGFMPAAGSGQRILEIGCGEGRDTVHLIELGEVTAFDIDQASLDACVRRVPEARLCRVDLADGLPYRPATFDFLLASLSLHYFSLAQTQVLVRELKRCLVPGGRAIVRVNSTNDVHYGAHSKDQIEPNFYRVRGQNKRFFDEVALQSLFNGWEIVSLQEQQIYRYAKLKTVWEVLLRS